MNYKNDLIGDYDSQNILSKNKYNIRTDLATEDTAKEKIEESEFNNNGIIIHKTIVSNDKNIDVSKKTNVKNTSVSKNTSVFYTLDTRAIKTHDNDDLENCIKVLADVIKEVMNIENIKPKSKGLIVGLGNINVTPDSLGPMVVDNVIVTRHMFILNPDGVSEGINEVSALAPGVMGTTGIETYDIIEAITKKIDIDYMIVVDALASRSIERVNKTIQVTNNGIRPGSGVGNKRKEISKETMGMPVIAIGVPTVVDAVTIASDTIDIIMKYMHSLQNKQKTIENISSIPRPDKEYREELFGDVGALSEEDKHSLIDEILTPNGFNMMVTPKEVDLDINDLTQVISSAIDKALHPLVGAHEN